MESPAPSPPVLRRDLLAWFDAGARDLPWRRSDDPYAIWVSEVMLQQTRVDTVVPYFRRWMERFPTVEVLADADLDEVLKAWEGLGYYRRARMLHGAAAVVRDRHGGHLPSSPGTLRELPGVGEYTAGAVASIAFGRATPAVDGNVRRVLSRLFDLPRPTAGELRTLAGELVDPTRPGDFNQALMELGATVCTPRSPRCGDCPWSGPCRARRLGLQESRPLPRERSGVREVDVGVAVVARQGTGSGRELFLVRRPEGGLLGGLWEFPGEETRSGEEAAGAAARAALRAGGPLVGEPTPLGPLSHAFSHLRATYHPFLHELGDGAGGSPSPGTGSGAGPSRAGAAGRVGGDDEAGWFSPAGLEELALPVAQRRILERAREALSPLSSTSPPFTEPEGPP